MLENRRFYWDKNYDEWRMRKTAGMGIDEWKILVQHADAIERALARRGPEVKADGT